MPDRRSLDEPGTRDVTHATARIGRLRADASDCTACPLFAAATQTVFGEGPADAPMMLVGEVPGDHEDLEGHPFVGPAGQLLRRALDDAGVAVERLYLTNAVKHFKFEQRGKRRLHKKPSRSEMVACRPWLEQELAVVDPLVVVALGVTAATSLLGRPATISKLRGQALPWEGPGSLVVTIHPSAALRATDGPTRSEVVAGLTADLRFAQDLVRGPRR